MRWRACSTSRSIWRRRATSCSPLRGRAHRLVSAVVLVRDGQRIWHHVDRADLRMREFSADFLDRYLQSSGDAALSSVGRLSAGGRGRAAVRQHRWRLLHHPGTAAVAAAGHPAGTRSCCRREQDRDSPVGGPMLSGRSRIAGVMGWPVAHSRSPRLHGYWLRTYGIDGAYIPLPVRPERFADGAAGVADAGICRRQRDGAAQGSGADRRRPQRSGGAPHRRRQHDRGGDRTEPSMAATATASGSSRTCARACRAGRRRRGRP